MCIRDRSFTIEVPALTQKEIDDELALMEKVKANYFNGIRGENKAIDNITTDLSPFQEVYDCLLYTSQDF